jgi:glycosyltransferase involved in cell wall biosynthesis
MTASIVIRTYNEERHLPDLLQAIDSQTTKGLPRETIIVDSGSTDGTLSIAQKHACKILHIEKHIFTFGRSLNYGCESAQGDYLVFVSGHCVPKNDDWLLNLVSPLQGADCAYVYGRQLGSGQSRFSECQLYKKFFPEESHIPQDGFFCNNANAALLKDVWRAHKFDEELTGLEDMELAKRLLAEGLKLGYTADAPVYHLHDETWVNVRNRYKREAIALQHIMPQIHISFLDFLRYYTSAVLLDMGAALQEKVLMKTFPEIVMFRLMQFWGSYRGNHEHRKLSREMKEKYFYPK